MGVLRYLLHRPCKLENAIGMLTHNVDKAEKETWRKGGLKDWESFLLMRQKELKPGKETHPLVHPLDKWLKLQSWNYRCTCHRFSIYLKCHL